MDSTNDEKQNILNVKNNKKRKQKQEQKPLTEKLVGKCEVVT